MLLSILYLCWYRFKCFKLCIDAAFYYAVKLQPVDVFHSITHVLLWIFIICILSPLEIVMVIVIKLIEATIGGNYATDQIKYMIMNEYGSKENVQHEYENYKDQVYKDL